jgi:hypothetical protein
MNLETRIEKLEKVVVGDNKPTRQEVLKAAWREVLFGEPFPFELTEEEMIEIDIPAAGRKIIGLCGNQSIRHSKASLAIQQRNYVNGAVA